MTIEEVNARHAAGFSAQYTLVPGEGNPAARLMLVGEAPGAQEEAQGRPFVGTAGKNLDAFLAGVSLERGDLYISNSVKFRPTKQGASGRLSNRTPTPAEVEAFRPWLMAEIEAVQPLVVATLGNTALRAVTGAKEMTIGDVHGVPLSCGDLTIFPLYHPASIIYRRELRETYEEDVKKLRMYMQSL